ncbi:hypothetical protein KSW85_13515 [Prevotella copri]|uniref:hypothetical protein n=1 Tax=Segatella copri TaxID=165179 RepID=UPI001C38E66C|nr:hypothetical protein [Segatella copri]MBV3402790.1 hypothetical protein [Segatella copri]
MDRTIVRHSTFNLPSMRRLWQVLGEYDALVEYIELTTRMFKTSFESQHELTFPEFLSSEAMKENICLNDLTLDNYETFKYKYYLILPNSSFDRFLDDFMIDFHTLFDKNIPLSRHKTKLHSIVDYLVGDSFSILLEDFSISLYDYYRLIRNSLAHDSLKKEPEIVEIFSSLNIAEVHSRYPRLSAPHDMDNLTFDDFILCTANIKSIADKLTKSLENKIDWGKFSRRNSNLFPKLKKFRSNRTRQVSYIKNVISDIYGIRLSDTCVDNILISIE